jgi:hypothetical protein
VRLSAIKINPRVDMANLQIKLRGSLGDETVEFSSRQFGHAHAVNEAIAFLTQLQVKAINADHAARDANETPPKEGFIKRALAKRKRPST